MVFRSTSGTADPTQSGGGAGVSTDPLAEPESLAKPTA
jgi:hypothetical protein